MEQRIDFDDDDPSTNVVSSSSLVPPPPKRYQAQTNETQSQVPVIATVRPTKRRRGRTQRIIVPQSAPSRSIHAVPKMHEKRSAIHNNHAQTDSLSLFLLEEPHQNPPPMAPATLKPAVNNEEPACLWALVATTTTTNNKSSTRSSPTFTVRNDNGADKKRKNATAKTVQWSQRKPCRESAAESPNAINNKQHCRESSSDDDDDYDNASRRRRSNARRASFAKASHHPTATTGTRQSRQPLSNVLSTATEKSTMAAVASCSETATTTECNGDDQAAAATDTGMKAERSTLVPNNFSCEDDKVPPPKDATTTSCAVEMDAADRSRESFSTDPSAILRDSKGGHEPPIGTVGTNIVNDTDVLCGFGTNINTHPGNRAFHDAMHRHGRAYWQAHKNDRPAICRSIVRAIRQNGGRFLKKDNASGLYFEIGDAAAHEKTRLAFRRRALEMRQLLLDTKRDEARAASAEDHRRQPPRLRMGLSKDDAAPLPSANAEAAAAADRLVEPFSTDNSAIPRDSEDGHEPIGLGAVTSTTTEVTTLDAELPPSLTRVEDVQYCRSQTKVKKGPRKDKSIMRSTDAENISKDVDSRGEIVEPTSDNDNVVCNIVYCGPKCKNFPGNCNFRRRVTECWESVEAWARKSKDAREMIYAKLCAEFIFVGGVEGEDYGQLLDENWCKDKIRKAFHDQRRRHGAPTEHPRPTGNGIITKGPILGKHRRSTRALQPGSHPDPIGNARDRKSRKRCAHVKDINSFSEDPVAQASGPCVKELVKSDWRCFENAVPLSEPAFPDLPHNMDVRWSWGDDDPGSRILYADLRGLTSISIESQRFYAKMLDRDDIALITLGMVEGLDKESVKSFLRSAFPWNQPYNLFRHFRRETSKKNSRGKNNSDETDPPFVEQNGSLRMGVHDFLDFLDANAAGESQSTKKKFVAYDGNDNEVPIVPGVDLLYMFDVDCPKLVNRLEDVYERQFKMKGAFPRGGWCMMSHVPAEYCPFMGPNCYITNGGTSTGLHQDGHGTVDSGHTVIAGYNEVVMLRRLPEIHKIKACMMMPGLENAELRCAEDILYGFPHDDCPEGASRPRWPTHDTIAKFKEMGYCPMVFIAEEGSHIHIPKGCLHIFRKMRVDPLPKDDCHCKLRAALVRKLGLKLMENPICFSIAFDWMYMGSDATGINRQVASIIECAGLCRKEGRRARSLAIPEVCVLKLAAVVAGHSADPSGHMVADWDNVCVRPNLKQIASGILPSLRYIVERDNGIPVGTPDTETPICSLDPYGNDYFCMVCDQELSNTYFNCEGCAKLLFKNFIICVQCYADGRHCRKETNDEEGEPSDLVHTGGHYGNAAFDECECDAGPCAFCTVVIDGGSEKSRCKQCSCTCHHSFTPRSRFFKPLELEQLLEDCTRFAGKEVPYAVETLARLQKVEPPAGAASDDGLAEVPQVDDAAAAVDDELAAVGPPAVNDVAAASDETTPPLFPKGGVAAAARDEELPAALPHAVDVAVAVVDEELTSFVPQVDDTAAGSNEALASFLPQVDDAAIDEVQAAVVPKAVADDDAVAASDEALASFLPQVDDAAAGSNDYLAMDDASNSQQVLDLEIFDDTSSSQVLDLEILSPTISY